MPITKKLKQTQKWMIFFTTVLIAIIFAARIFYGEVGFYWALGSTQILMAAIHFLVLLQTRNPVYLITVSFYGFMALVFLPPLDGHPWRLFFAVAAGVFLILHIFVLISKQINWRYREILELAARPVEGAADGFAARPFPSGSADYTREDARRLARFLLKYVIAYPVFEADRVVLIIPRYMWSYLLFFKPSYDNETYVAFNDAGEVSVRIAKPDYQAYKEELTFDQLCASLGDLFKQFMGMHRQGEAKAIIERLNSV
jgi:hypothetical protein